MTSPSAQLPLSQSMPHQSLLTQLVQPSDTSSVSPQFPSSDFEPDPKFVMKIQKNIRAHMIKIQLKGQFKRMHQRRRIIKQLLETEERYIRDLGFIVSDFNMRMRSRGILTGQQCDKLFANVDQIRKLHDIFFSTLYEHFARYHPYLMIFADVLAHISYFRIYIQYLNNFPFACDLVEQFKKNKPHFAKFVSEINRNALYKGLGLEDYMIMPIQRLPRYCLLLKELIKNTLPSHPDYENVKRALNLFEDVNSSNNQKLDKIRNSYRLRQLEQQLKLPEDIITPSSEFIMEESVQIINKQNNQVLPNCVIYLLSNTVIITRRCGALAFRDTRVPTSHSARISQVSGYGCSNFKQKLEAIATLKYATSVQLNKDQCFFKNSFTIQTEGESCTFICSNQQQLHSLFTRVKKQRDIVKEVTIAKLKSIFQSDVQQNCQFLKNISMLDILPEVSVLGTTQRTDKMLKYTVYIVEVKVKMIRQKIFLRFSQLLELEKFINNEYGSKVAIKQGLVSSGWLNNHHQKTIEERKMNIQRFLKEILSKPEIIKNGWKILLRLGLPGDFFELPNSIGKNKNIQSFVRKSTAFGKSTIIGNHKKKKKVVPTYRLSLFQQQRIQQEQDQNSDGDEQIVQDIIKQSFHEAPKSSFGSTQQSQNLCIQDILKANQVDLGHYTRGQSVDYEQNNPYYRMDNFNSIVELQVHVPNIQFLYSSRSGRSQSSVKGFEKIGHKKIIVKCSKMQRIQNIVPIIAKEINLKYYKDFRLVVEKEYSQRVLDDDELVHKVLGEVNRTRSCILFKKIIFIDHTIQERQLTSDRQRLMIEASQTINEIKMGKYRLNYESYLKFAVLSSIVFIQNQPFSKQLSQATLSSLARQSKNIIFPKYSSLSQTDDVWVSDFLKVFQIIRNKLKQIVGLNDQHIDKHKSNMSGAKEIEDHESSFNLTSSSYWVNTSVLYLAMLSIVKQIQKSEVLYGCVSFSVQISEDFKDFLEREINIEIENLFKLKSLAYVETIQKQTKYFSQITNERVSTDDLQSIRLSKRISEQQNKNCWLAIKHNKILFTSISKNCILLELNYQNLIKIETYASAVVLQVRGMQIKRIKLKTTSSYYIREMLVYYRNYRSVLKKIYTDNQLKDSVLQLSREEYGETRQQMDQYYL